MNLTRLGEQMVRMAARGRPAVETAATPLVGPEKILSWLVLAAEQERLQSRSGQRARLWKHIGRPVLVDAPTAAEEPPAFIGYLGEARLLNGQRFAPRGTDPDFGSYVRRVESSLQGEQFGYQVPYLHNVTWDAYRCFLEVIGPMLAEVGLRRARFTCFFGNYWKTPFGAHIDHHHQHVFQYVVHGRRRLRAWDVPQLIATLGETRVLEVIEDPLAHAAKLPDIDHHDAQPGDLLYWPGDRMHLVEADEPSMGVSVVFESEPWRPQDVLRRKLGKLAVRPPTQRDPRRGKEHVRQVTKTRSLSAAAAAELGQIARRLAGHAVTEQALLALLAEQTGRLFNAVPGLREGAPITPDDALASRLHPQFPIRWAVHHARVLFAANGHSASWGDEHDRPGVVRLLAYLNEAAQFRVAELVGSRKTVGRLGAEEVCSLLTFLVAAGAFDRVEG